MAQGFVYYHNPKCGTSRKGRELLEGHNISFEVKEYLKEPLKAKEILEIVDLLGGDPETIIRKKEQVYKDLDLGGKKLTKTQWAKLIVDNPILLERPILVGKKKAAVGRPLENFLPLIK